MRSSWRRLPAICLLPALVACSSPSARRALADSATTSVPTPTSGDAISGPATLPSRSTTTAAHDGSATSPGPTTGPANGQSASATTPPRQSSPSSGADESAMAAAARGPVGGFARTLLAPRPAAAITVEVLAQSGAAPRSTTVQHVTGALRDASGGKTVGSGNGVVPGGARNWTTDDITAAADAADAARGVHQGAGGVAVVHALYLHGDYGGDKSVLGVAVRGDVVAVLVDQLQASATVAVPEAVLEDAVSMHELGHVLGLVDLVLHTGRQDPQHPGHSQDRGSVMYWAVDTDLVSQLLQGGPSTEFDDADRRDLATIHDGG